MIGGAALEAAGWPSASKEGCTSGSASRGGRTASSIAPGLWSKATACFSDKSCSASRRSRKSELPGIQASSASKALACSRAT